MAFVNQAASSYDAVARSRTTDMTSKEVPFRHFNNFVKKEVIQSALDIIHEGLPGTTEVTVLDIGSGRGGDVGKWLFMQSPALSWKTAKLERDQLTKASRYMCYDVSPECIAEAERRFRTFETHSCTADFTVADCYSESFRNTLTRDGLVAQAHIVSIQFAFHYACASRESIAMTLSNVAMCLCQGGVFIGTTVDLAALSSALQRGKESNSLYAIELLNGTASHVQSGLLPIGTAYNFRLEGFVDCPEYVVPMDEVKAIAADYGLQWVPEHSLTFSEMVPSYITNPKKNKGNVLSQDETDLVSLYRCFCFIKL